MFQDVNLPFNLTHGNSKKLRTRKIRTSAILEAILKAWAPSMTSLRNTKHANFKEDNISSKMVECAVLWLGVQTKRPGIPKDG